VALVAEEQAYPRACQTRASEVSVVLAADLDAHFPIPVRTPEDLVFARPEIYTQ